MNLFVDFMLCIATYPNEIIKGPATCRNLDELAVLEWLDHQLGGGGDCNRYFNRVKNFAHCYANELKRWIAIESNAALLAEQWGDVRGWPEPEDSPQLTVDDFAWDRLHFDIEQSKFWVPMRRLPFCEIGADLKSCDFLTNGLLPSGKETMNWPFDFWRSLY